MDVKNYNQESYNPVEDEILHPDEGEGEDENEQTDSCD